MRSVKVLGIGIFIGCSVSVFSQSGNNCTNAINIPLDGNCNNYSVSTTTGGALFCNVGGGPGWGGNGRVTYFRFTTNASAECVLLDITTSVADVTLEAVLFTGCSGGSPTGGNGGQSLCMSDGDGIWATNLWYSNLSPNTTYYLRVRTESGFTGSLQICGKYYTPTNNLCSGATSIDPSDIIDNNACNVGSTEVAPSTLCAGSLENTAWYSYTVNVTGVTNLVIGNLDCDNTNFLGGGPGDDYGFQIGFYTGTCGSLTNIGCYAETSTEGGFIIANTSSLPAGTVVYVAIDGFAGSNCTYSIHAVNSIPLPVKLKYFTGWKGKDFNRLTWVSLTETNNDHFEIERSSDGRNFSVIGSVAGKINSTTTTDYSFTDGEPLQTGYYRLKMVDVSGNKTYSKIIKIVRENIYTLSALFTNPVHNILKLNIETAFPGSVNLRIVDLAGRNMLTEMVSCHKGINMHYKDLSKLPAGSYYLVLTQEGYRKTYPFIKQ